MNRTPVRLYQEIVSVSLAIENCKKSGNTEWQEKHEDTLSWLGDRLPSGSGVDRGTTIKQATESRLVLEFGYHHMDDSGYYCGWTDHMCIVEPTLRHDGFNVRITGVNKRDCKEYLGVLYHCALKQWVWQKEDGNWACSHERPAAQPVYLKQVSPRV